MVDAVVEKLSLLLKAGMMNLRAISGLTMQMKSHWITVYRPSHQKGIQPLVPVCFDIPPAS